MTEIETCPIQVADDTGWHFRRCSRPVKRVGLCGIHAAAKEKRERNADARSQRATAGQAVVDRLRAHGVRAYVNYDGAATLGISAELLAELLDAHGHEVRADVALGEREALRSVVVAGLRKCRVEDGAPVPLIREGDLFHISHMVTEEVAALIAKAKAEAWTEGFDRGFYDPLAGHGATGRDASESAAANPYDREPR